MAIAISKSKAEIVITSVNNKSEGMLKKIMSNKLNVPKWRRFLSFTKDSKKSFAGKNVLIVDDEEPFLMSTIDGLSAYAEDYHVLTALNGEEAINTLKSAKVDLLVTDLKMPKMNGLQLIAYMNRNHPGTPIIVMTAYGTQQIETRLRDDMGILNYIEKPLDINILAESISNGLMTDDSDRSSQNISLASFLQLVEMEKTTCTLKITSEDRIGYIYFKNGEIMEAETHELNGKEAAMDITSWDNCDIDIMFSCKIEEKRIESNLTQILSDHPIIKMEAKAEKEANLEAEAETKAKAENKAKLKAEAEAKAEREAKLEAEAETKAKAEKGKITMQKLRAWKKT